MGSISNNTLSQEYYYQVTQNSATFAQSSTQSATSNVDPTSVAPATSTTNTANPTIDPSDPSSGASGVHHHHRGHGGGGGGGGLEKIVQTVQSALSSSTSSATDPNQVITNALQQLFGDNGEGTTTDGDNSTNGETNALLGTTSGTSSSGTSSATDSTDSTDGDGSVDGTDATSSSQTLAQLLQSYGVSPQQFRSDLISALSGSGGSLNESLFQNFEPGSGVDAIA